MSSWLRRFFSGKPVANEEGKQPGKHVANTDLDDSLTHRIDQWRRSRLPALIRLERSYAQAHHALAHTQAEIDRLLHGPTHVQATAPSDGSELVNRVHDMHAKLLRQEEGLQAICWQLHKRLQAAQAEAEAQRQVGNPDPTPTPPHTRSRTDRDASERGAGRKSTDHCQ